MDIPFSDLCVALTAAPFFPKTQILGRILSASSTIYIVTKQTNLWSTPLVNVFKWLNLAVVSLDASEERFLFLWGFLILMMFSTWAVLAFSVFRFKKSLTVPVAFIMCLRFLFGLISYGCVSFSFVLLALADCDYGAFDSLPGSNRYFSYGCVKDAGSTVGLCASILVFFMFGATVLAQALIYPSDPNSVALFRRSHPRMDSATVAAQLTLVVLEILLQQYPALFGVVYILVTTTLLAGWLLLQPIHSHAVQDFQSALAAVPVWAGMCFLSIVSYSVDTESEAHDLSDMAATTTTSSTIDSIVFVVGIIPVMILFAFVSRKTRQHLKDWTLRHLDDIPSDRASFRTAVDSYDTTSSLSAIESCKAILLEVGVRATIEQVDHNHVVTKTATASVHKACALMRRAIIRYPQSEYLRLQYCALLLRAKTRGEAVVKTIQKCEKLRFDDEQQIFLICLRRYATIQMRTNLYRRGKYSSQRGSSDNGGPNNGFGSGGAETLNEMEMKQKLSEAALLYAKCQQLLSDIWNVLSKDATAKLKKPRNKNAKKKKTTMLRKNSESSESGSSRKLGITTLRLRGRNADATKDDINKKGGVTVSDSDGDDGGDDDHNTSPTVTEDEKHVADGISDGNNANFVPISGHSFKLIANSLEALKNEEKKADAAFEFLMTQDSESPELLHTFACYVRSVKLNETMARDLEARRDVAILSREAAMKKVLARSARMKAENDDDDNDDDNDNDSDSDSDQNSDSFASSEAEDNDDGNSEDDVAHDDNRVNNNSNGGGGDNNNEDDDDDVVSPTEDDEEQSDNNRRRRRRGQKNDKKTRRSAASPQLHSPLAPSSPVRMQPDWLTLASRNQHKDTHIKNSVAFEVGSVDNVAHSSDTTQQQDQDENDSDEQRRRRGAGGHGKEVTPKEEEQGRLQLDSDDMDDDLFDSVAGDKQQQKNPSGAGAAGATAAAPATANGHHHHHQQQAANRLPPLPTAVVDAHRKDLQKINGARDPNVASTFTASVAAAAAATTTTTTGRHALATRNRDKNRRKMDDKSTNSSGTSSSYQSFEQAIARERTELMTNVLVRVNKLKLKLRIATLMLLASSSLLLWVYADLADDAVTACSDTDFSGLRRFGTAHIAYQVRKMHVAAFNEDPVTFAASAQMTMFLAGAFDDIHSELAHARHIYSSRLRNFYDTPSVQLREVGGSVQGGSPFIVGNVTGSVAMERFLSAALEVARANMSDFINFNKNDPHSFPDFFFIMDNTNDLFRAMDTATSLTILETDQIVLICILVMGGLTIVSFMAECLIVLGVFRPAVKTLFLELDRNVSSLATVSRNDRSSMASFFRALKEEAEIIAASLGPSGGNNNNIDSRTDSRNLQSMTGDTSRPAKEGGVPTFSHFFTSLPGMKGNPGFASSSESLLLRPTVMRNSPKNTFAAIEEEKPADIVIHHVGGAVRRGSEIISPPSPASSAFSSRNNNHNEAVESAHLVNFSITTNKNADDGSGGGGGGGFSLPPPQQQQQQQEDIPLTIRLPNKTPSVVSGLSPAGSVDGRNFDNNKNGLTPRSTGKKTPPSVRFQEPDTGSAVAAKNLVEQVSAKLMQHSNGENGEHASPVAVGGKNVKAILKENHDDKANDNNKKSSSKNNDTRAAAKIKRKKSDEEDHPDAGSAIDAFSVSPNGSSSESSSSTSSSDDDDDSDDDDSDDAAGKVKGKQQQQQKQQPNGDGVRSDAELRLIKDSDLELHTPNGDNVEGNLEEEDTANMHLDDAFRLRVSYERARLGSPDVRNIRIAAAAAGPAGGAGAGGDGERSSASSGSRVMDESWSPRIIESEAAMRDVSPRPIISPRAPISPHLGPGTAAQQQKQNGEALLLPPKDQVDGAVKAAAAAVAATTGAAVAIAGAAAAAPPPPPAAPAAVAAADPASKEDVQHELEQHQKSHHRSRNIQRQVILERWYFVCLLLVSCCLAIVYYFGFSSLSDLMDAARSMNNVARRRDYMSGMTWISFELMHCYENKTSLCGGLQEETHSEASIRCYLREMLVATTKTHEADLDGINGWLRAEKHAIDNGWGTSDWSTPCSFFTDQEDLYKAGMDLGAGVVPDDARLKEFMYAENHCLADPEIFSSLSVLVDNSRMQVRLAQFSKDKCTFFNQGDPQVMLGLNRLFEDIIANYGFIYHQPIMTPTGPNFPKNAMNFILKYVEGSDEWLQGLQKGAILMEATILLLFDQDLKLVSAAYSVLAFAALLQLFWLGSQVHHTMTENMQVSLIVQRVLRAPEITRRMHRH